MSHRAPAVKCASHRSYLLSCDEYEELLNRSGNRCEICSVPAEETSHGVLHIDHDPSRGQGAVRGLLCSRCNTGLSLVSRPTDRTAEWLARPLFRERRRLPARDKLQKVYCNLGFPTTTWDRFGELVGLRKRSKILVEFMRWYNREPGAKLPPRPDA